MYELDYILDKRLYVIRDKLLVDFLTYLTDDKVLNITKHKHKLSSNAISCFILNTYKSYSKGAKVTPITLHRSPYSSRLIINGRDVKRQVSYTYTRYLLDFLTEYDYIQLNTGSVTEFGYDYTLGKFGILSTEASKVVHQESLISLFDSIGDKVNVQNKNVLQLRGKDKTNKTFPLNPALRVTRDYLDSYNLFSSDFLVAVGEEVLDVQMYKVYNRFIEFGGRSYVNSRIQQMSKEEREQLTIDGAKTVCFDYGSFEPSLAYSISQEVMEGDAYTIVLEGFDKEFLRGLCKKALIMMLNTKSRDKALKALDSYIKQTYSLTELKDQGKIPFDWIPTKNILKLLESKHEVISHMFYNDSSGNLQQVGSLINDYVVQVMMQKYGSLCLQVHDCFIVKEEFEETIQEVMEKGYQTIFGFSDNCTIVKEF